MAVQLSVAVRNARLDAIEATIGASAIMRIRTGAQPANCAAADSGDVLATLTLPSDWLAAASSGSKGKPVYDAVIMNPPFSRRQDVHHVTRALDHLKPGGKLAAITSAGVLYRDDRIGREFRDLVARHGGTIQENPARSFHASGTDVGTCTVRVIRS